MLSSEFSAAPRAFPSRSRVLVAAGRDRLRFLHAVTTQDVGLLEPGQGAYGALTDDRGRPVSDFFLYVLPDVVLLEAPAGSADALRATLERLIIADDVVLAWADTKTLTYEAPSPADLAGMLGETRGREGWFVPSVESLADRSPGVGWAEFFDAEDPDEHPDSPALAALPRRRQVVLRASRYGGVGAMDWSDPGEAGTPTRAKFYAPLDPTSAMFDALEILAFRPGPPEFAEAKLWNELDRMDAVSFDKGCFMGQEILNRVHAQGQLQRRLVSLELDRFAPDTPGIWRGAELVTRAGLPAGTITRAGDNVAFAFVRRDSWEPGSLLIVRLPGARNETIGAMVRPKPAVEVS